MRIIALAAFGAAVIAASSATVTYAATSSGSAAQEVLAVRSGTDKACVSGGALCVTVDCFSDLADVIIADAGGFAVRGSYTGAADTTPFTADVDGGARWLANGANTVDLHVRNWMSFVVQDGNAALDVTVTHTSSSAAMLQVYLHHPGGSDTHQCEASATVTPAA